MFLTWPLFGQNIEFTGIFASSSSKTFKNSFGYSLGYNKIIKTKNKLGVSFSHYSYGATYDNIYHPEYDPSSLSITETDANNKRFALKLNYAFRLVNNPKSKLYLGPEIGLNYFKIKESTERIANGQIESGTFNDDYRVNNKLGIGFILEFQLDEVISKRVSTVFSLNPEITGFEEFGAMGSADPWSIGWLNFKLGVRYKLKNE
ncbi:MAG TPA: hypothetical protein DER09_03910 [Prolixibacteraceae bacterium]|nr:hypothetical protein [Prolixibacteraceae bacterium]